MARDRAGKGERKCAPGSPCWQRSDCKAQALPGDPAAGLDYARAVCADCHDVEREWDELAASYGPPFVDIAAMPSTTEMSLKVFLRTPHENMPNLILTDQERDDVVAYILSLRPER